MAIKVEKDKKSTLGIQVNGKTVEEIAKELYKEYIAPRAYGEKNGGKMEQTLESTGTKGLEKYMTELNYLLHDDGDHYPTFDDHYYASLLAGDFSHVDIDNNDIVSHIKDVSFSVPLGADVASIRDALMVYEYALKKLDGMSIKDAKASKYYEIKNKIETYFNQLKRLKRGEFERNETVFDSKELLGEEEFKQLDDLCVVKALDKNLIKQQLKDASKVENVEQYVDDLEKQGQIHDDRIEKDAEHERKKERIHQELENVKNTVVDVIKYIPNQIKKASEDRKIKIEKAKAEKQDIYGINIGKEPEQD